MGKYIVIFHSINILVLHKMEISMWWLYVCFFEENTATPEFAVHCVTTVEWVGTLRQLVSQCSLTRQIQMYSRYKDKVKGMTNQGGNYTIEAVPVSPNDVYVESCVLIEDSSINESRKEQIDEFLSNLKWPNGLKNCFHKSNKKIPYRFIICDDSGSMITNDGKRIQDNGRSKRCVYSF